ncbi:hypothetical protein SNE25_21080 [Mucilaginibacter sabulilitoris]|uniref:Uncharacterized protein n=1 Tax=Mucilaginibacter sabulilitoris TaxID=1173583 RepID=A0ABZ0TF68_9SPHI|nr:hypothetical protein [Mucilaginibacter sabulilitoris]WPU91814.1 hypothetical protein SNE25_21080 [Mucilaginibacter sabulilitoris]
MATAHTTIERLEFIIEDKLTHCNIFYSSDEPGTPWGGGWKTKTFSSDVSAIDILKDHVSDYIMWSNGREGVKQ